MVALALFAGVMGLVLVGFLFYHLYLIYVGKTTNEAFKWNDLKKVYNKLVSAHVKYLHKNIGRPKSVPTEVSNDKSGGKDKGNDKDKGMDDTVRPSVKADDSTVPVESVPSSSQGMRTRRSAAAAAGNDTTNVTTDRVNTEHSSSSSTSSSSSSSSAAEAKGQKVVIGDHDDDDDADVGCIPFPSLKKVDNKSHTFIHVLDSLDGFPELLEEHPGPFPTNIYRQNFVQRLYEVFSPPSLSSIRALQKEMMKEQRNASEVAMATSEDRIQGTNYNTPDLATTTSNNQSVNDSASTDLKSSSEGGSTNDTIPSLEHHQTEKMTNNGHHHDTEKKSTVVDEPKKTK